MYVYANTRRLVSYTYHVWRYRIQTWRDFKCDVILIPFRRTYVSICDLISSCYFWFAKQHDEQPSLFLFLFFFFFVHTFVYQRSEKNSHPYGKRQSRPTTYHIIWMHHVYERGNTYYTYVCMYTTKITMCLSYYIRVLLMSSKYYYISLTIFSSENTNNSNRCFGCKNHIR